MSRIFFAAAMSRRVGRLVRLENLRIKLTQTFIKDSVRSGLSLAITFVSRGSAHPLTPRCGKEKIKYAQYAQNPPLMQHE